MADSTTIFDDVFVPWERVFLCGEHYFASMLAMLFATFHRHSYTGCKPAISDLILGASALVTDYSGIAAASVLAAIDAGCDATAASPTPLM